MLVLLLCACSAARPLPRSAGTPPCDALPLLGKADPSALASDGEGGLAMAGSFAGTLRAGNATAASAGGDDVFVLRTNPDGSVRWLHRIGGPGDEDASAVALTAEGDAIVGGRASGQCFLARLAAADGRELWTATLPGQSNCRALSLDARGDVWATGYFAGKLAGAASNGMYDLFVARFAGGSGEAVVVRTIGGKGKELPRAIVALPSGEVLVAGQFGGEVDVTESDVDFGKGPVRSSGDYDGFLLKLAPDGKTLWVSTFGDNGDDEINALAAGEGGAIFAAGHHQPAGNYRDVNPHSVPNFQGIVLRYAADGRGEWVRIFGGDGTTVANHLAFDLRGRLWTGGVTRGFRLDDLAVEGVGGGDAYLLALNPADGRVLGSRRWASPQFEITRGITPIPGGLAATGFTTGELQLCGKAIGTPGEQTAWLLWLRDL